VDSSATDVKAREHLRLRFETCYPFHPATLSVFQRKWQALSQYQQTRGTLAMLAQWISWAYRTGFAEARREALITLGSAPLDVPDFRGVALGQLGDPRLVTALDSDVCGPQSHARTLDADTKGALRSIHRRAGTVIFFESSGGQKDRVAHLPELRFALGEPDLDTTSVDTAALALEEKSYFVRRVGSDGFKITHQPTMKKVVNDRRASLDEDSEVKPTMRDVVRKEFERGATVPLVCFPADGAAVQDTPRLTLVLMDPGQEWDAAAKDLRRTVAEWTRQRGNSPRLYPGALVWCLRKPGRDLREKVETWLAWQKVAREVAQGTLGSEFDAADRDVRGKLAVAEDTAKDEVWAGYRFAVVADAAEPDGLKAIDLGAGHSSASETLCGRVITALKSQALLNESVGVGYIDRNWPPALKASGAWPLSSLRQSFLDGALTRLLDPDTVLRRRIVEAVETGDFGLASGHRHDGTYDRLWYQDAVAGDEVTFEPSVFLLTRARAQALKAEPAGAPSAKTPPAQQPPAGKGATPGTAVTPAPGGGTPEPGPSTRVLVVSGEVPPELWNRLGTKLVPKLKGGSDVSLRIEFRTTVAADAAAALSCELRQALQDLGLEDKVRVD